MKKKLFALGLVLALGATLVVGGSLAWFTDTDEATNTFAVGSVEIVQLEDFVQNAQLIPVVKTPNHGDADTVTADNNYIKKEVSVKNTGENPAYVQTFVAIPAALDNGLLHQHLGNNTDWTQVAKRENQSIAFDHDDDSTNADITQAFNVYCYRYRDALNVGLETSDVLSGIYVDAAVDIKVSRDSNDDIEHAYFVWNGAEITEFDLADSGNMKLHVLVATQAIQSQGFENAEAAFNSGAFPTHPWA